MIKIQRIFRWSVLATVSLCLAVSSCKKDTDTGVKNTEAKILEFKLDARAATGRFITGKIDEATHTIIVGVPIKIVDRSKLPFAVTLSDGATITPAATDTIDFTSPVTFKVKAQSGAEQVYTVKVLNSETNMYFEIPYISSWGIPGAYRYSYSLVTGASPGYPEDTAGITTPLFAIFAVLETEDVSNMIFHKVTLPQGATLSPAADAPQNFNRDVIYTLTSEVGAKALCTVRMLKRKIVLFDEFIPGSTHYIQKGGQTSNIPYIAASDAVQVWFVNTGTNTTYDCTLLHAPRGSQGEGNISFTVNEAAIPKSTPLYLKVKLADGSVVLTRPKWILN